MASHLRISQASESHCSLYYLVFGKCLSYGPPDRATVGISEWAEDEGLVDRELHADPLNIPPAHT